MDSQEQEAILQKCRDFAWAADELEFKYFNTPFDAEPPRDDWFILEFEQLIEQYCYGNYKRTADGPASCWMPPRYTPVRTAVETMIETPTKTRVIATFFLEPKVGSVRFILDKRKGEWRIIRYETYLGFWKEDEQRWIAKDSWAKHRL